MGPRLAGALYFGFLRLDGVHGLGRRPYRLHRGALLQALGGLGIAAYGLGVWWTLRENPFAAPVVKIQESQRAIDTGPYAIVRHPMYASGLFLFIGIPLLLGSWLGLAFSALFILAIAWRAVQEERALRAELTGYEDYAARVRSRLVPFVW
jgi:protein-S-isoprenylcysteine O-methyltransferase Ste14